MGEKHAENVRRDCLVSTCAVDVGSGRWMSAASLQLPRGCGESVLRSAALSETWIWSPPAVATWSTRASHHDAATNRDRARVHWSTVPVHRERRGWLLRVGASVKIK